MDLYREILTKYWGYTSFRPLQEEIINSVADGRDTLGLMPTGGGKSLTFQVPVMAMRGICIVVTPLIALMKDQVDNLRRRKIKATAVYSGMTRDEIITQLENCIFGDYKFLYVSPERIHTELFRAKLAAMDVCLLVVDECHCISQWGYDFRPSYLKIAEIREELPYVPVLALTATATPVAVNDIQQQLHFKRPNVLSKSFLRKNLSYTVRKTDDKMGTLIHILNRVPGSAIVYVRSREKTKEIATLLRAEGIEADHYHAGLNRDEKTKRQERWKDNECRVIVSTNAFGMGIDKPDVRLVVHMDMPSSLEEYFQEAGRAGRDERKAYAVALCSGVDNAKLKKRLADEYPEKAFIRNVYDILGSYFQIAVGYGTHAVYDFSLADFCSAYKFPMLPTHHALKILELSGYIEYTEDPDKQSRLMFITTRNDLYNHSRDQRTEAIIQTVLRSYTGLFADYVHIDESVIATRSETTRQEVYDALIALSKSRIINYIPQKQMPLITYTQFREESKYITIPPDAYDIRKDKSQERIESVLEYINVDNCCRSRMLLTYFGEENAPDCGICDVCAGGKHDNLNDFDLKRISKLVKMICVLQAGKPVLLSELVEELPYPKERTLAVIRYLADHDEHFTLQEEGLTYKAGK